jgi:hypothetical protein
MPWKSIKEQLKSAQETLQEGAEKVNAKVKESISSLPTLPTSAISELVEETKETVSGLTESIKTKAESTRDELQNLAEKTNSLAQDTLQEGARLTQSAQRSVVEGVERTSKGVSQVTRAVNDGIAREIDHLVGDRAKPITDFIREEGIQVVAGLAFTPIYVAQRGVIGYEAYVAFDHGEINLGELVLQIVSPGARSAQEFLSDPENQEKIANIISKVIPRKTQEDYLGRVSQAGSQVGGLIPQTPTERMNSLLGYRKPRRDRGQGLPLGAGEAEVSAIDPTQREELPSTELESTGEEKFDLSSEMASLDEPLGDQVITHDNAPLMREIESDPPSSSSSTNPLANTLTPVISKPTS